MLKGLSFVVALCVILVGVAYVVSSSGHLAGPYVLATAAMPLAGAKLFRLELTGLLPDLIFGVTDTGPLTLGALIGAASFGATGAILGAVVGDAITDGIAGFFEGGWPNGSGIEA